MASLAQLLLSRRSYHDKLTGHWSRWRVRELTSVLYAIDPMGLTGFFGLPRDEYEPEAIEILARLLGVHGDDPVHDSLWDFQQPASFLLARDSSALRQVCIDSFRALFRQDCAGAFDDAALAEIARVCLLLEDGEA